MSAVYRSACCTGEIESVDDVPTFDLVADIRRDGTVKRDAIGKTRHPAFRRDLQGTQHSGAIQFVVVAMVEMPWKPLRKPLAVDLDHARAVRLTAHVDHPRHVLLIGARYGRNGVILERAEYIADGHVHAARGSTSSKMIRPRS